MNEERKSIINPSLPAFMREFQEHVQQGWELDEANGPKMWGIAYETGLVRNDKTVTAMVERLDEQGMPKPVRTRAEILADARQAKADKRAREAQGNAGTN
jgi:hypothetical protein